MSILSQDIMYLPGVGPKKKTLLSNDIGVNTYGDLLEYYPYKYVDRSRIYTIREMTGEMPYVQAVGRILSWDVFDMTPRKQRYVAHFSDGTGVMDLVWFNGGKYARQTYKVGEEYVVFGKPSVFSGRINIQHPDIESGEGLQLSEMGLQPHYNTTEKMKQSGLNSRGMERLTKTLVEKIT
ncbi:MAG: ATP-dependent DNA helicase RecG, partial [Prevotella sp.]|nr:ATP-dependent DNA helicase RecG [Prevotella sp.]